MKISFDVEELKRSLLASATTAKNQLSEMAKQAQVQERFDQAIEMVKASDLMKNPKVTALTKRLVKVSGQWEKVLSDVVSRVNGVASKKKAPGKKKAAKKDEKLPH